MRRRRLALASAVAIAIGQTASAKDDRERLPISMPSPLTATIGQTADISTPAPGFALAAPEAAPNIVLFMSDDVGFAMSSVFGGPVPTPNFARLAAQGVRFNSFHTTGICSPTRASLLTGRNHHRVATGFLTDLSSGYPGYEGHFPPSAATIAQTLRLNGYSTAMFGKHHNVPPAERTVSGPFDMWPTGLGFDHFYGFIGGDTDQWHPTLYRGTSFLAGQRDNSVALDRRLADEAINWVHNQSAATPDRPFFIYYAPGSTHAPHQAPAEFVARFKGKFDHGWDAEREAIFRRQLAQGIVPRGTVLTPRPAEIPAWTSLTPAQKAFATRSMEAAAGQLAYQDEQFGRLIAELERMGRLDKTLFAIIQGDNGASAEAGPAGTINEIGHMANGIVEDDAWLAENVEKLGGPETYASYPAGWAWAMATPLRWTKQYASMLGGIRNGMILSWQGQAARPGSVCARFGHVVDIAPTLLEASGLPAPKTVHGTVQAAFDGVSLASSLKDCQPDKPRTQYFEIAGKVGFYRDGWFLSGDDGRLPWTVQPPASFDSAKPNWALYDLRSDFSQAKDLAAKSPKLVKSMVANWQAVARDNQVLPIEHRFFRPRLANPLTGRKRYDYWGGNISVPASDGPNFVGRSFTLTARIAGNTPEASGAIVAFGGWFGGWSLYLEDGKPRFVHALSTNPRDIVRLAAEERLPAAATELRLRVVSAGPGKAAEIALDRDGTTIAEGHVPKTLFMQAPNGEMFDVGRDTGVPVTRYATPDGRFDGRIDHVSVVFDD